ncbi:hypothetical protein [Capnocytophaga canimorsus]|uniref:hypothetical protein n=1 Tax=Capnocytophaga canimorsus TaxID=28188 RepID=UPI001EE0756A|nr:hypothetical protein [Capnocytophaga canimorsus]GJQ05567.1 hypothetical protein CAPN009_19820 [Capnocytophaga canimorsus]
MHEEQIFITPAVINQRLRRNIRSGDGYTAFMPFSDCSSKRMLGGTTRTRKPITGSSSSS